MKRKLQVSTIAMLLAVAGLGAAHGRSSHRDPGFEVWAIDQSGIAGTLYVYDRADFRRGGRAASPKAIDLDSSCPGAVRGHMLMFNHHDKSQAIISFVGSGHVLFMDAATRSAITCIDVGVQAHAAVPSPDDGYVIVADQNGKKLHRIDPDVDGDGESYEGPADIALDPAATLDLATCTTPNGTPCQDTTLRPDNAPICPIVDSSGRLTFVTLRGGGLFVVDATTTPISIVAEYDKETVHPNGCGGLETAGKMYVNAGGPGEAHLYAFSIADFSPRTSPFAPNTPAPATVFAKHGGEHDSHGMLLNEATHGRYLWVADRFSNEIEVVDTETDQLVDTFTLSGRVSADPAPDLIEIAPGGEFGLVTLRGPCPLTANSAAFNNAVGNTPGLGLIKVRKGGRSGELEVVLPVANPAPFGFDCPTRTDDAPGSITNQADPHGLAVRPTDE